MIGNALLVPETKKPVSNTGAFGTSTARLNSNLFDTHSVHHTGGMCKDSLLNSQENFLNVSAYLVRVVVAASFRKEYLAMNNAKTTTESAIGAESFAPIGVLL